MPVQYPARHQAKHQPLFADHKRVSGIGSAREAHDHIHVLTEKIDDLPFSLVAPLGAYHDDRWHLVVLRLP
jgi:hypothetical protein